MAALTGQAIPYFFSEIDDRAVHVIDLRLAALHQVLPHRGDGARAGEDAIDQRDEILIERRRRPRFATATHSSMICRFKPFSCGSTMPPTSDPSSAVVGLITQLKIAFRHISFLMSGMMRPSSPASVSTRRDRRRLRVRFEQRVAGDGVVDDARPHQHAADLGDRAQHQRAIADQLLDEIFGVQPVLHADDRHVLRQHSTIGATAATLLLTLVVSRISVPGSIARTVVKAGSRSVADRWPCMTRPSRWIAATWRGAADQRDVVMGRQLRAVDAADRAGAEDDDVHRPFILAVSIRTTLRRPPLRVSYCAFPDSIA